MSDKVQNIRIKYVVDTGDLGDAKKALNTLTKEEKDLKSAFDDVNKSAKKQEDTIDDLGDSYKKTAKKAEQSAGSLKDSIKGIGGAIAGAFAVSELISFQKKIIEITAAFQKYEAVLTNTLGSKSAAQAAMKDIQAFAAQTPFSVAELTESFVKLANQGFVPNVQQLGDLASSTGKSFDQLSEAILDAQSGQFERLKEFGIKASKSGDQVSFSFKGVTSSVKNSSSEIQKYILSLGDLKGVSGSMAAISGTLEGQLSNLGDTFDSLLLSIGKKQSGGLSAGITILGDTIAEVTKAVNGQSSVFDRLIITVKSLYQPYADLFKNLYSIAEAMGIVSGKGSILEGVFFAIEKVVKLATLPIRIFVQTLNIGLDLITLKLDKVGDDFIRLGEIITLTDGQIKKEGLAGIIETTAARKKAIQDEIDAYYAGRAKILKAEEARAKAAADVTDKEQKEIDKRFKAQLDYLAKMEALRIRQAKLEGASNIDLLEIEKQFNQDRIDLYKAYGRQRTIEAKNLVLKEREIENQIVAAQIEDERAILKTKIELEQKGLDAEAKIRAERIAAMHKERDLINAEQKKADEAEKARLKKLEDDKANIRKQAAQMAVTLIGDIGNGLFQIQQQQLDNKMTDLQKKQQEELDMYGHNEQSKAAINKKFADEEAKLKRQQAVAQREEAIFNLTLQNSQNIVKYAGGLPLTAPLLALSVATFGAQLALILSKPLPKFNRGVERLTGAGTETSDSILAQLSVGERVVSAKDNRDYYPALSAMHNHKIPAAAMNAFVMDYSSMRAPISLRAEAYDPELKSELKSINKTLKSLPVAQIHMDKKGLRTFLKAGDSETEFLNNYFRN